MPPSDALAISLVGALAVRTAISRAAGLETRLKWPNDLFVGRRKIAGVIASERGERIALGIGVDANVKLSDLPDDVAALATSIEEETGKPVALTALLAGFIDELQQRLPLWRAADPALRQEAWGCLIHEHPVRWRAGSTSAALDGRIVGLERNGGLTIESPAGVKKTVLTGDLEVVWPRI